MILTKGPICQRVCSISGLQSYLQRRLASGCASTRLSSSATDHRPLEETMRDISDHTVREGMHPSLASSSSVPALDVRCLALRRVARTDRRSNDQGGDRQNVPEEPKEPTSPSRSRIPKPVSLQLTSAQHHLAARLQHSPLGWIRCLCNFLVIMSSSLRPPIESLEWGPALPRLRYRTDSSSDFPNAMSITALDHSRRHKAIIRCQLELISRRCMPRMMFT
ncbi:hypothetical protein GE09DRAFT_633582 [Coniochaeta sp. 2T2.1]|nr:hypothetical protein GE09DRAFT_633582 [Coniochaeta sp. 2T2.1]